VLRPKTAAELGSGLASAVADGYSVLGMKHPGMIVLEKAGTTSQP
jgi:hypothetical protein